MFVAGAAVQWLRDGLGIIEQRGRDAGPGRSRCRTPAASTSCPPSSGLGAPYWDPYARGTLVGITRGTTRAHLARAALEAIAYQSRDVLDDDGGASPGVPLTTLRVDGGAAANDFLCQFQADVLGVEVLRPSVTETTGLGAAYLAGRGRGALEEPGAGRPLEARARGSPPRCRAGRARGGLRAAGAARSSGRAGWIEPDRRDA